MQDENIINRRNLLQGAEGKGTTPGLTVWRERETQQGSVKNSTGENNAQPQRTDSNTVV